MIKKIALFFSIYLFSFFSYAFNKEQLQRGAQLYMNYCSGCHSLQYMRYSRMAEDLGLINSNGQPDEELMQKNLIFTKASLYAPILIAMPATDAKQWFGVVPPDLSLIIKIRGEKWLYQYLRSFYRDNSRPLGVNNLMFPDVAMPAALEHLSGTMTLMYNNQTHSSSLILVEKGAMNQLEFDNALQDLVTFLAYVGDPNQIQRYQTGTMVILFLIILLAVAVLLKNSYWRVLNIKPGTPRYHSTAFSRLKK